MPGQTPDMPMAEPAGGKRLSNIVQLSEARAIMATLEACGGSRVRAARQGERWVAQSVEVL